MYGFDWDLDSYEDEYDFEEAESITSVRVVDFEKMAAMISVVRLLQDLLTDSLSEGRINVEFEPVQGYGTVEVETDELVIYNPGAFAEAIRGANNFEVYPLTNGKIRVGFMFHNLTVDVT